MYVWVGAGGGVGWGGVGRTNLISCSLWVTEHCFHYQDVCVGGGWGWVGWGGVGRTNLISCSLWVTEHCFHYQVL